MSDLPFLRYVLIEWSLNDTRGHFRRAIEGGGARKEDRRHTDNSRGLKVQSKYAESQNALHVISSG